MYTPRSILKLESQGSGGVQVSPQYGISGGWSRFYAPVCFREGGDREERELSVIVIKWEHADIAEEVRRMLCRRVERARAREVILCIQQYRGFLRPTQHPWNDPLLAGIKDELARCIYSPAWPPGILQERKKGFESAV